MMRNKRRISNDFNSSIKRRRVHEPTIINEPHTVVGGDSESLDTACVQGPRTKSPRKKPDEDDLVSGLSSGLAVSTIGGRTVSALTGTKKKSASKNALASPSARRVHNDLLLDGIPPASGHSRHQRTIEGAEAPRFCSLSSFPCSSKSKSPSMMHGAFPASHQTVSPRLRGRGFLTTSGGTTVMPPPLPSFLVGPQEYMRHGHTHPLSALTPTSYRNLLLFDAHRKSLDEELALAGRVSNGLQQERDFLLTQKDSLTASLTRGFRRVDPSSLLSSHQQAYIAGAHAARRQHFLGQSRGASSSWLGTTTPTAYDITLGLPQRTLEEPFLPYKEYQAILLQQALAARNHDDTGHRPHHGFEAVPPMSSRIESMLLSRQECSRVNTGSGKTTQPLEPQNSATGCLDLPDHKALHSTTSVKTSRDRNSGGRSSNIIHLLALSVETDKNTSHFSERICIPLATDEDPNWLSEFLCFVRSEIVEVFRASRSDVKSRNTTKKVNLGQVGIRCRFCAHKPLTNRTKRSSSFPFTMSRIYQSLTMMLRDHFGDCHFIPDPIKERYLLLKGKTPQGASGSNQYWEESARSLGLIDSPLGIWVQESSDFQGNRIHDEEHLAKYLPFRQLQIQTKNCDLKPRSVLGQEVPLMVQPDDQPFISDFLYELLSQIQLVHLDESERVGNRKNLKAGMAGLGCRYCCQNNRKGLCRTFPARRRTLPLKLSDLYEHIRRCSLCPKEQRERLILLKKKNEDSRKKEAKAGETAFLDRLWERMTAKTNLSTES